jgi:hypothetical protein
MPSDIENIQARQRRRVSHPSHVCPEQAEITRDLEWLIDELTTARAAVEALTENDEDLRASAEIWCRLYDAALARAASAEAEAARAEPVPQNMQVLYEALDRVADLTDALGTVVRECAVCARTGTAHAISAVASASEACTRCARALEALGRRTT